MTGDVLQYSASWRRRLRRWRRWLGRHLGSVPVGAGERACRPPGDARGLPYHWTLPSAWRRER